MWRTICGSVRGATHIRNGKPNQDSIKCRISERGEYGIMAVADGHGSGKCFRSDLGSKIVVDTAIELLEKIVQQSKGANHSFIKDLIESKLPGTLVSQWKKRVDEDYRTRGFSDLSRGEDSLSFEAGFAESEIAPAEIHVAYGTTLLASVVTSRYIAGIQIGDGEILVVSEDGSVERPIPKDERLFANETTSLCSEHAIADFRFFFERLSGITPALLLLTTDGYANSFKDEAGFLKVGTDILKMIKVEGPKYVEENLENWLDEASKRGSGDDITLGILYRQEIMERVE